MPTSPNASKTRFYFWLVFAALYTVSTFSTLLIARKLNFPGEYNSSLTVPLMGISMVVTTLIFRKRGTPVVEQAIQVSKKKADIADEETAQCELHMSRKSWRGLTTFFGGFLLLLIFLVFCFPPKPKEEIYVGLIVGLFGTIALSFAVLGWLWPSFIARVDAKGITTSRGWLKRKFVSWSQIASCEQTQTSFIPYKSRGIIWQFKDAQGKVLLQVTPFEVSQEQQEQFSQVLTHYMTPSVPVIKES